MITSSAVEFVQDGISRFFGWWFAELRGLLPTRLRPAARSRREFFLSWVEGRLHRVLEEDAAPDGAERTVPFDDAAVRALRAGGRQRADVVLRLRRDQGLRRSLDLPIAVKDDIEQMLGLEMDRLTPFRADEVYFAHRIAALDHERQRLSVELHLAPKAVVDQALAAVRHLGVRVKRIELARPGPDGPLNLLPRELLEPQRGSRLNRVLALSALVLATIAVAIPLQKQRTTAADLDRQVAAAKAAAEESLALRERLDELTAGARFVVEKKAEAPMITRALAELTRRIPDHAYVAQLHLEDDAIQLHGYAEAASELIGALAQSPLFREPQFRSPVTRDPRNQQERFHISVELTGGGGG